MTKNIITTSNRSLPLILEDKVVHLCVKYFNTKNMSKDSRLGKFFNGGRSIGVAETSLLAGLTFLAISSATIL